MVREGLTTSQDEPAQQPPQCPETDSDVSPPPAPLGPPDEPPASLGYDEPAEPPTARMQPDPAVVRTPPPPMTPSGEATNIPAVQEGLKISQAELARQHTPSPETDSAAVVSSPPPLSEPTKDSPPAGLSPLEEPL